MSGRLALLVLLAAMWAPGARAAVLGCAPLDTAAVAPPDAGAFRHGLLFRVEPPVGPGGWVFGTIHVGDPAVLALPRPVRDAFAGARRFVMEAVPDGPGSETLARAMTFDDGATLEHAVGRPLAEATVALLARYGMSRALAVRLRPWAAFLTLSLPPASRDGALDIVLMRQARERGLSVSGLETVAEQVALFSELPLADQRVLLAHQVCHYATWQRQVDALVGRWLARDLAGLLAVAARHQPMAGGAFSRLMQRVLTERNRHMAERIAALLAADGGPAFVAIGALHLPGEDGVLARLAAAGLRVERLY